MQEGLPLTEELFKAVQEGVTQYDLQPERHVHTMRCLRSEWLQIVRAVGLINASNGDKNHPELLSINQFTKAAALEKAAQVIQALGSQLPAASVNNADVGVFERTVHHRVPSLWNLTFFPFPTPALGAGRNVSTPNRYLVTSYSHPVGHSALSPLFTPGVNNKMRNSLAV